LHPELLYNTQVEEKVEKCYNVYMEDDDWCNMYYKNISDKVNELTI
jgi:hypothetical protein